MDEKKMRPDEGSPRINIGYESKYVLCPFFHSLKNQCINCEGLDDGYVCTTLRFVTNEKRKQHMKIFCEAKFRNCEIHAMLMATKYNDD